MSEASQPEELPADHSKGTHAKRARRSRKKPAAEQGPPRHEPDVFDQAIADRQAAEATPPAVQKSELATADPGQAKKEWVSKLPDPFGRDSIDLGDGRRLQFNRSSKWQQMQIKFVATQEGVDPKPKQEDGDTQWLRERGWNWKGDPGTKAWTVQLLKPEEKDLPAEEKPRLRAATDRQAEHDFIELAQRIRARNGLSAVSRFATDERSM